MSSARFRFQVLFRSRNAKVKRSYACIDAPTVLEIRFSST